MSTTDGTVAPSGPQSTGSDKDLTERIQLLETAVTDADNGAITNARKLEALSALDEFIPSLQRPELVKHQPRVQDLCERLVAQNATEPLRRLTVSVLNSLYRYGDSSALPTFVSRLLKLTGDQNKKASTDTRVAALDIVGELVAQHGRQLEHFANDIFVYVAKHMKFPEASARCSALHCLCKTIVVAGVNTAGTASHIWKMLQKMLLDKAASVRAATAHGLAALVKASPAITGGASANGDAMAVACLKALASDDPPGAAASEGRVAFAGALAQVLAAMATPVPPAPGDRPKKKPAVTDFASAAEFLEQAVAKGPSGGQVAVNFRAAICLASVRLADAMDVADSASIVLLMRSLLNVLEMPSQSKSRSSSGAAEDECLAQIARHLGNALRQLLLLADSEACLLDVIEQGLLPLVSTQIPEASRSTDMRMVVVLEALCYACVTAGESFRSIEAKVSKPLLHLVGNHPSPIVQLHATYSLRVIAHGSPPQLFQLMSVLLNLATVQNAELLGTPVPRRRDGAGTAGQASASASGAVSADLQALLRGLFGHCSALAALNGELFHSKLGVPHDVTSAVLGTSRALLQPHPNTTVSAQRRSCAFLLLEGLMCLGTDWVGQRLTTLFALWKTALGKKPVDRAKVLYQQHAAATPSSDGGANSDCSSGACRDELFSLLCALRSLYSFTLHSHETLLTSYSHLHKILVVFLTNISQLVVALPHPTSPSLRAKYRSDSSSASKAIVTLSAHCEIPDILVIIRSTMYRTFAAMLPTQYSSRFVPLLNMLADDVTRAMPADFPTADFLGHFLHPDDAPLDLVDNYTESSKDGGATIRLAVTRLLSASPVSRSPEELSSDSPKDLLSDVAAASYFSGAPREGPGGTEVLLTPWDAWFSPSRSLAEQCTSAEWEWRCSAVSLLAIIMNASEVSEAPRSAVLLHLLKRKEPGEEGGAGQHGKRSAPQQGDLSVVPSLAVLMYLREHVRTRGVKVMPPQAAMEQVLQLSVEGLKDANPAVRRLHVELLAILFYVHHQMPESPIVPSIMQYISGESPVEGPAMRSAVALLCGSVLRAFAWGNVQLAAGTAAPRGLGCPYIMNITPALLKHAKETSQPVRLWMLHALHLSMQAAGIAFLPFLKDALRLATAHLLADFFEAPLVLWVIAELVQSAASLPSDSEEQISEEHVSRILGIWNELKHVRYAGPGNSLAFATVRTEVLCISTASAVMKLAPLALNQLKDAAALAGATLAPDDAGAAVSVRATRAAAARCLRDLAAPGLRLGQDPTIMQDPLQLLMLLEGAQAPEAEALMELVRALVRQRGLQQLPSWLQALREVILALPPKARGADGKEEQSAPAREEAARDEHDDGASMAGPSREERGGEERKRRAPRSGTKVFAVSCLQLLLEQADPNDTAHFQTDLPDSGAVARQGLPEHRLVQHLESMVGLAAHASSSDEESMAAAGLRLMLLIVRRFRNTRDVQSQSDSESCPLLLVQYEAQVTTCIRHNSRPETNPTVLCLALELLRDVIVAQACNSKQRLIGLLTQPFSVAAFEPDPMFCEFASTRTFLVRLQGACEILDSNPEEPALAQRMKDIARWLELALRDCAVLLAGLPLQSIKTYQPACFSLADYKVVQPRFREAVPAMLRGVCALCDERRAAALHGAPEVVTLALGAVLLLLGDSGPGPSEADVKVYLRTIRQVLLHSATAERPSGGAATVGISCFMDLLACVWRHVFRHPARCGALLPDVLELLHAVSGAIWRPRRSSSSGEGRTTPKRGGVAPLDSPDGSPTEGGETASWLDALTGDSEERERRLGTIGACCLHVVAAALRCPAVVEDAAHVARALEVFVWWLGDALPRSLESSGRDSGSGLREREDEIVAAALEEEEPGPDAQDGLHEGPHCSWLWLLFLSPFPVELMQAQPAVTQKYWRMACAVLSAPAPSAQGPAYATKQLLYLALIANKLCKSFLAVLDEGGASLSQAAERSVVLTCALLVPTVSALCTVLQQAEGAAPSSERAKAAASRCLSQVREVFARGLGHGSAKVAQTAASSAQSLLQSPGCAALCPVVLPRLVAALAQDAPGLPAPAVEAAWGAVTAAALGQRESSPGALAEATTSLVLRVALRIADHTAKQPGSFGAHRSPLAQCLVQLARADPQGLKAEVAGFSAEGQQAIQQLLREHMSAASRGAGVAPASGIAPLAAKKIELKLKF